tara:strand:+ start:32879 stop:35206 length:2328 start_codon:yes stop_codon:yes gene_type:complete
MPTISADLVKNPGMSLLQLESMLNEIQLQPVWRDEAQRAAAYYDGKQLEPKIIEALKDRGQAPLVYNLIGPTIDAVLGIEAKTRTDWVVRPDDDNSLEVAEGLNERLNEEARLALADRGVADGYAAQVKTGLGWVEVNRNIDPFASKYRVEYINRNEIHWDWHAKRPDLRDARYLVRDRWLDKDRALLAFPRHEHLINMAINGWRIWSSVWTDEKPELLVHLQHAYAEHQQTTLDEETWFNRERERVRVFEIWYRTYQRGVILRMNDGRVIEYDQRNPVHKAAIYHKHAMPESGVFPKMRLAYFLGCHRVVDVPSPLPHDNFPYIPMWGFREDGTGIPYGLIRRMMSPQDEVNARRSKMMWLLSAKRTIMDKDATDMDIEELTDEIQRPDGVIILNPSRQNRDQYAFRVEQDFQLASQQFEVMVESQKMIQETAGVYSALMGKQDGGADSGVAIASLVEQGSTTLAELNDNYRFGRRLVGQALLSLIVQDMGRNPQDVAVNLTKPQRTKHVKLNHREATEDGRVLITNDVTRAKTQVVLDDIQATAGYRAQVANRLFEVTATLPDEIKGAVLDVIIEATDIPQRDELAKRIRAVTGVGGDPADMTPEQQQELAEKQALQKEQQTLELEELRQRVEKLRAEAAKSMATADKTGAETKSQRLADRKTDAETDLILAEMAKLIQEMNAASEMLRQDNADKEATIKAYESVLPDVMAMRATAPAKPKAEATGTTQATPPARPEPAAARPVPVSPPSARPRPVEPAQSLRRPGQPENREG